MKKLKLSKLELAQMKIGQKELSELKGGYDNNNTSWFCGCDYNNTSYTNHNDAFACSCNCV